MASKTWFLPPDFTFLPDGQIALGRVIPKPSQPTVTLASLGSKPSPKITLPTTTIIIEKNRSFSTKKSRSFGFELFAKCLELASADAKADVTWYKNKAFGTVDHEVRTYSDAFDPDTLKAVLEIPKVREYIDGGRFGRRCVYIISGLRVAIDSFTVTDEKGFKNATAIHGSGSTLAGGGFIEVGAEASVNNDDEKNESYETAPGIVFAYRLHVIRPQASTELFSDPTAFCGGEAEIEEEEGDMEIVEVDEAVLQEDLEINPVEFEVQTIEGYDESYVIVRGEQSGLASEF